MKNSDESRRTLPRTRMFPCLWPLYPGLAFATLLPAAAALRPRSGVIFSSASASQSVSAKPPLNNGSQPVTGAVSPLRLYFRHHPALRGMLRGLAAWWSAEGDGSDPVGGHTGQAVNGLRYWPGKFGEAFLFNGTDSALVVPDSPSFKLQHSMTLSTWISIWSVSDGCEILFRGDNRPGLDPYTISEVRGPGGTPVVQFQIESFAADGRQRVVSVSAPAPCQQFFLLTATLDDRTGAMNLYLNGRLAASAVVDNRPFGDLDPGQRPAFSLGNVQDPSVFNEPFHGLLDEVMVFSRALTPAEIQDLYRAGVLAGNVPRPASVDRLVFSRHNAGQQTICSVRSTGGELKQLSARDTTGADPTWSPDGNQIIFSRQDSKTWQLYRANADGTDAVRLTNDEFDDYAPAWSPDARRIAFVSTRSGRPEIYIMNSDGTDQAQLTADTAGDDSPTWLPDGSRIAFVSSRGGQRQIYNVCPDGTYPEQLTTAPFDHLDSAWSPDGRQLALVRQDSAGASSIWIMNRNGKQLRAVVNDGLSNRHPAWSPDGRLIAFSSNGGGDRHLFLIKVKGGMRRRLTEGAYSDDFPHWRPHGR